MAAPAATTPQQQSQQQQDDARLIALLVAAFVTYHTASAILSAVRAPFLAAGISVRALQAAIGLALAKPLPPMKGAGAAARWAVRANQMRRSAFALAAARRIQQAVADARSQGEPVPDAVRAAVATEQQYLRQHWDASRGRVDAAAAVDSAASKYGKLLGWQAIKDPRCTPGCAAASGSNFRVGNPPVVEGHPAYPGMVHGATCRCIPVAPFKDARVMP